MTDIQGEKGVLGSKLQGNFCYSCFEIFRKMYVLLKIHKLSVHFLEVLRGRSPYRPPPLLPKTVRLWLGRLENHRTSVAVEGVAGEEAPTCRASAGRPGTGSFGEAGTCSRRSTGIPRCGNSCSYQGKHMHVLLFTYYYTIIEKSKRSIRRPRISSNILVLNILLQSYTKG